MEYQDLIYKKSNLEENDSITNYNGWAAQQNPHAFPVFFDFLKHIKPKRILEIGTALGGFTFFLKQSCNKIGLECNILTYDIISRNQYSEMIQTGIDVRIENVFNNNYSKVNEEVIEFIKKEGVTLILCDGGNKIGEFNLLSKFMKSGDIIMAHDYAKNKEHFDKEINRKLWNWFEISDKDIEVACNENGLKDLNKENFEKAVWVCKIKE